VLADLDRSPGFVERRAEQVEDGLGVGEPEEAGFLGGRHAGGDFLGEPGRPVTCFGQPGVDAARAAVLLDHLGAVCERPRHVGGGELHRLAGGVHLAPADQGLVLGLEPQPLGDLRRRGHRADLDQLHSGLQADCFISRS
jgi:hypothetical protein